MRAWGDAEVLAHRQDAAVIRGERPRAEPVLTAAERPLYDQVVTSVPGIPPCRVDGELADGDTIDFGGGARVIAVPGHTDGGVAILLARPSVLFTGVSRHAGIPRPLIHAIHAWLTTGRPAPPRAEDWPREPGS